MTGMSARTGYASAHELHTSSDASSSTASVARHWGQTRISRRAGSRFMAAILVAAHERKNLVTDARHGGFVIGLDVESQQRFGVGRTDVEPPGVTGDSQSCLLYTSDAADEEDS